MADELEYGDYDGVLIGTLGKREREQIRIGVREFRGARFIDVRTFFEADGEWHPTHKGVTIPIDAYAEFAETVAALGDALGYSAA